MRSDDGLLWRIEENPEQSLKRQCIKNSLLVLGHSCFLFSCDLCKVKICSVVEAAVAPALVPA